MWRSHGRIPMRGCALFLVVAMRTLVVGGTKGTGAVFAWQRESVVSFGRDACDITDTDATRLFLQSVVSHGKLSGLVFFQRFRGSGDAWTGEMDLLRGMCNLIDYVVEHRMHTERAAIVMVSSIADAYVADQPLSYHVAKSGVAATMRYYAVKLAPHIRVNCVSPCVLIKPASKDFTPPAIYDRLEQATPMGIDLAQQGVIEAINFLLDSRYITGQNIVVDGGLTLRSHESLLRDGA